MNTQGVIRGLPKAQIWVLIWKSIMGKEEKEELENKEPRALKEVEGGKEEEEWEDQV